MAKYNILASLVLTVIANSAFAINPASMGSLKPYQKFAPGAGDGYAKVYKQTRTKADFVAMLRDADLAKQEMRVDCSKLISQIVEGHPGLQLEGCPGAASAIEADPDYDVVDCDVAILAKYHVGVTNADGTAFGTWPRACLPGKEPILTYKGDYLASLRCLNPLYPKDMAPAPAPVVVEEEMPPAVPFVDAFAGKDGCDIGPGSARYVALHMMEPKASQDACAVKYMLPRDGRLDPSINQARTWTEAEGHFSKECFGPMHSGNYEFGVETHEIEFAAVDAEGKHPFFVGTVTGKKLVAGRTGASLLTDNNEVVRIPGSAKTGYSVVAFYRGQTLRMTPTDSGIGKDIATFNKDDNGNELTCHVTVFTGIDAPAAPAATSASTATSAGP